MNHDSTSHDSTELEADRSKPGSLSRDDLIAYLDQLLDSPQSKDYGPNGLQVEGTSTIEVLVTGVSPCVELFERAAREGADAVLVHHGMFWDGQPVVLTGHRAARVRALMAADMNLIAYHLPLDRHPVYGNNALAARGYGLVDVEPFGSGRGGPVGVRGRFPEPVSADALRQRTAELFGQEPLHYADGPDPVSTLGMVSGAAHSLLGEAVAAGLDAFVTGEVAEWVMTTAREEGIHFLAAGHYATETAGVKAVGDHLADRFGLRHVFIDVPNTV